MRRHIKTFFLAITLCFSGISLINSSPSSAAILQKALTKAEVLKKLEAANKHEIVQGDIAAEVNERGIDFSLTDDILKELRRAGAKSIVIDALLRASANKSMPATDLPEGNNNTSPNGEIDPASEAKRIAELPVIEQARHYALSYVEELPNFVVNQRVLRYVREPNGQWRSRDILDVEVTYESTKGESYKLKYVNGKPANNNYDSVGGASSTGEFGTVLVALFRPDAKAEFKQGPSDRVDGRKATIYDFRILTRNSTYQVTETRSNKSVISGYKGSIWIDEETKRVLRIEQSADDIPPNFPITVSESAVDYGWFEINGEKFLLPKRAELIIGSDRDRLYSRNVLEFTNYRRFDTDIRIGGADDN